MKKTVLMSVLFVVVFGMAFAQEWEAFDLFGGEVYGDETGSTLKARLAGDALIFSGSANERSAGYVIDSPNLGLGGMNQIKLEITGIDERDDFDLGKLLKLELDGEAIKTQNIRHRNRNDDKFINARNGSYIFEITNSDEIEKINIVFYKCTVQGVSVKVSVR